MRVTTKSKCALKIMMEVALADHTGVLAKGSDISSRQDIPKPFLEQIMVKLKKGGLVSAVRGIKGGYKLRRPAEFITLSDIVTIFEGEIDFDKSAKRQTSLQKNSHCATSDVWQEVSRGIDDLLKSISLKSVINKQNALNMNQIEYAI